MTYLAAVSERSLKWHRTPLEIFSGRAELGERSESAL